MSRTKSSETLLSSESNESEADAPALASLPGTLTADESTFAASSSPDSASGTALPLRPRIPENETASPLRPRIPDSAAYAAERAKMKLTRRISAEAPLPQLLGAAGPLRKTSSSLDINRDMHGVRTPPPGPPDSFHAEFPQQQEEEEKEEASWEILEAPGESEAAPFAPQQPVTDPDCMICSVLPSLVFCSSCTQRIRAFEKAWQEQRAAQDGTPAAVVEVDPMIAQLQKAERAQRAALSQQFTRSLDRDMREQAQLREAQEAQRRELARSLSDDRDHRDQLSALRTTGGESMLELDQEMASFGIERTSSNHLSKVGIGSPVAAAVGDKDKGRDRGGRSSIERVKAKLGVGGGGGGSGGGGSSGSGHLGKGKPGRSLSDGHTEWTEGATPRSAANESLL